MRNKDKQAIVRCECSTLDDVAIVDMGDESNDIFDTLDEVRKRGLPYWWLSAYRCCTCGQWWLVAQEERQNDVFCLRRLGRKEVERLLNFNSWPEDFDRYETLLRMGAEAGKRVTFLAPFNSSLVRTLADLAREHPRITRAEISYLLNLELELAEELARKVMQENGVEIDFSERL